MKQRLKQYEAALAVLSAFVKKYEHLLPEDVGCIGIDGPSCGIHTGYHAEDRNRVLSLAGDVFGRAGWMRKLNYNKNAFDWSKDVEGVNVTIWNAEPVPTPDQTPVAPSAFPIQIAEYSEEAQ